MEGLDDAGVFFSCNFSVSQNVDGTANVAMKKQFVEFLRDFTLEKNFTLSTETPSRTIISGKLK